MKRSWSNIIEALFGTAMGIHTVLTALLILISSPASISHGDWAGLALILLVNWACFGVGKLAWLFRSRLFIGKTDVRSILAGTFAGVIATFALTYLLGLPATLCWDNQAPSLGGVAVVTIAGGPLLSYILHGAEGRWKWVRWLVPFILFFTLCVQSP